MTKRVSIAELNKYLVCKLCDGYFRDAYTVSECLHTFCRQCLYDAFNAPSLSSTKYCPECKASLGVKPKVVFDRNLQACVDKIFPEFLQREQKEAEQISSGDSSRKRSRSEDKNYSLQEKGSPDVKENKPSSEDLLDSSKEIAIGNSGSASTAVHISKQNTKLSPNKHASVNTHPFVLVTMKFPGSEHLENLTEATLRVQLNSQLIRLLEFLIKKYAKEEMDTQTMATMLQFTNSLGAVVDLNTSLQAIAKSVGYTGEVDHEQNAILGGVRLILVLQATWLK